MDVLDPRTVPAGATARLAQAHASARRQRGTDAAGRLEITPIAQEYMLSAVADPPGYQYPAGTLSTHPPAVCAEMAHYGTLGLRDDHEY